MRRIYSAASLLFLAGCSHFMGPPPPMEEVPPAEAISYEYSPDGRIVTIHIPHGVTIHGETVDELLQRAAGEDTLVQYAYREISSDRRSVTITLEEDRSRLPRPASELTEEYGGERIEPRDLSYFANLSLLLPCPGVPLPRDANLLPNAPRDYRSGTHRGIDFPAPYGKQVRSVAAGAVIRADHDYREVTNDFRNSLLKEASLVGYTPADVFEHILLGRSVFVDHGVDLIPGKRAVSIYAHLSEIDEAIQVGKVVRRGQLLGLCGNSGTSDGALGSREGAHLHFELTIQDQTGERYMGEGVPYSELVDLLDSVFTGSPR